MADQQPPSQSLTPLGIPEQPHVPMVPSPLNPDARPAAPLAAVVAREQREKRESLKKRESGATKASAPSALGKRKANTPHAHPSPQRFNINTPQLRDFDPPAEDRLASHEPVPFTCPDGATELFKPIDLAENKKGYRYTRCIADPLFPHKQLFRSTSPPPHGSRLSFEDADKWIHFDSYARLATNEKGWRMCRANVCAREGTLYYEVRITRGVPAFGPAAPTDAAGPQPHVRVGWARREAPLDAPVGFDGYSYGITDIRFEAMHRSRPGKFFTPAKKPKSKAAKALPPAYITLPEADAHVREGDVIGLEIQLPSLSLHKKIVDGVYNPAVDIGDGFDDSATHPQQVEGEEMDVIRDRVPVHYRGNMYFETIDHVASKAMEQYADRTLSLSSLGQPAASTANQSIKQAPHPNHESASLRTLPGSAMRIYKNGKVIGTAFENLLAFLPPASGPSKVMGAREGLDDAMIGYFPAISCFWGGIAEINFGDGEEGFWAPPAHIRTTKVAAGHDVAMSGTEQSAGVGGSKGWAPGRTPRGIGERYKEQVAEDVVWDIVDEVDFFMQDGGYEGKVGQGAVDTRAEGRRDRFKEEND